MNWLMGGWARLVFAAALGIATFAVYSKSISHGFLLYDDNLYVTENSKVIGGMSLTGVLWAFGAFHGGNWHPITTLSHMLDCELFGLNPFGHHAINVLFHTANSMLLFLLLSFICRDHWKALAAAGLFALHPLRVESVAWISERKDVLSGLFFLVTISCYVLYVRGRDTCKSQGPSDGINVGLQRWGIIRPNFWYFGSLVALCLGLMSKPMLVTTPLVLLLLDVWPLQRCDPSIWGSLRWTFIREKVPFLAASALCAGATMIAQAHAGAVASLDTIPLTARLANAITACWRYIGKIVWPSELAVIYPYPTEWSGLVVWLALLALVGATFLAWRMRCRMPWILVGWLYFLITLLPVIGIIQVGEQSIADRYTYIPSIGLVVAVVWTVVESATSRRSSVYSLFLGMLVFLSWRTASQLEQWKDSVTLFQHALKVTKNNPTAHRMLGLAHLAQNEPTKALHEFEAALRLNPMDSLAHNNAGLALCEIGRMEEALWHLKKAAELSPSDPTPHFNLGNFYNPKYVDGRRSAPASRGATPDYKDAEESRKYYALAAGLAPSDPAILLNWGILEADQGNLANARSCFSNAFALQPGNAAALFNLGRVERDQGDIKTALRHFEAALRISPENTSWIRETASLLLASGRVVESIELYAHNAQLLQNDPRAHQELGTAYARAKGWKEAVACHRKALSLNSNWLPSINDLAWILATHPDRRMRNPSEAVELASKAAELTQYKDPIVLGTLGVAHAEVGDWTNAIKTTETAQVLANRSGNSQLANRFGNRLLLFRSHKPFAEEFEQHVVLPEPRDQTNQPTIGK